MSGLVVAPVPAFNEEHYVASVLVRLREYVDMMIVDPSVVSEKNK